MTSEELEARLNIAHVRVMVAANESRLIQVQVRAGTATLDDLRAKLQETTELRAVSYGLACELDAAVMADAVHAAEQRAGLDTEMGALRLALDAIRGKV